jgi:hypothetical protein
MIENVIVMPGPGLSPLNAVRNVGRSFGWDVEIADDLSDVCAAQLCRRTAALLFHRDAFGDRSWLGCVRLLKLTLPRIRLIVCHGFGEPIDWPELCDAGAFDSLWLPLKEDELRRTFGFVWEAEKRRAESGVRVPLVVSAPKLRVKHGMKPLLARDVPLMASAVA